MAEGIYFSAQAKISEASALELNPYPNAAADAVPVGRSF
jgi:hypothetical protein